MKTFTSKPVRRVAGTHRVPGDKSISHRAVMLAALADGRTLKLDTSAYRKEANASKGKDAKKIGIATGVGAAIGAIAGGGKGAAIGAGSAPQQRLLVAFGLWSSEQTPVSGSTSSTRRAASKSPASAATTDRTCSYPVSIRNVGARP